MVRAATFPFENVGLNVVSGKNYERKIGSKHARRGGGGGCYIVQVAAVEDTPCVPYSSRRCPQTDDQIRVKRYMTEVKQITERSIPGFF